MILTGLLFVSALGLPYFTRPVEKEADLAQLEAEIATGKPAAEPWREKLRLYLELGELAEIPELIARLAAAFPDDPVFQEARMMFLSLEGRHAEAIALGEDILRRFPNYPTIRVNLGRACLEGKERARGVNLLIAALEQGPIRVEDWELLLEALGLIGPAAKNPQGVAATLRQKVAEHPERGSLRYVLLVVLTRLGHYAEARQLLLEHPELAAHAELRAFIENCCPAGGAAEQN